MAKRQSLDYPNCGCNVGVTVVKRIYRNHTQHFWYECAHCGRLGSRAIRAGKIPPDVQKNAPTRSLGTGLTPPMVPQLFG